jgi:hypothetical protein
VGAPTAGGGGGGGGGGTTPISSPAPGPVVTPAPSPSPTPAPAPGPLPTPKPSGRALVITLGPSGRRATIAAVLRAGGFRTRFAATGAGRLAITWSTTARRPLVVASATITYKKASAQTFTIRLTSKGKALLRKAKHITLSAKATFTPRGAKASATTRRFRL